jgi:pimeloyl-ACP methyl ester carboxylesterase
MDTQTINVNGLTIEYYLSTGKNEAIVLVNGAGGPIFGWYKIVDELSSNYTVLAYNRPGIGKSSKPASPQRFSQSADDLLELLNQLKINTK